MKKRLIGIILASAIIGNTGVMASEIDFSQYSVDELMVMRSEIDSILVNNNGKYIIPYGDYVVGRDIAAGSYVVTAYPTGDLNGGAFYRIQKYEGADRDYKSLKAQYDAAEENGEDTSGLPELDYFQYYTGDLKDITNVTGPIKITLEDGQVLSLITWYGPATMTIEKVSSFFME